jgi:prepilin-type N-terminal cleavage/methylation domain-containing protein
MLNRAHRAHGFTLLELLIAVAAMAFVLVYTLGTFTANRNAYVVIESVSEAHQNTLAIAGLVERDIRNAGYMVPQAAAACGVDSTTAADLLFVSDSDAIEVADELDDEFAGGNLAAAPTGAVPTNWGAPQAIDLDEVTIDGTATYDTDGNGTPDSDFRQNGGVIFTNLDDPADGVYCGIVTDVDPGTNEITISLRSPFNLASTVGTWAFVPAHVYALNTGTLSRDGVLLARDVEDLQVAWFYDLDEDGQVDGNENFGAGGTEPNLDAGALADPALLREVRFNLVARTSDNDPVDPTAGIGQMRENQTVAPAADGRRRRVHTSTIRLRNLSV